MVNGQKRRSGPTAGGANVESIHSALPRHRSDWARVERCYAVESVAPGTFHDFSALAGIALGRLEALMLRTEHGDVSRADLRSTLVAVRAAVLELTRVVDGYHWLLRGDSGGEPTQQDLGAVVRRAVALVRPYCHRGGNGNHSVAIHLEMDPLPPVRCRPSELRGALVSILLNALEAMPEGGTLGVRACAVGGDVEIVVADTGVGMTPEVLARAGKPHFTTKGERGTGLGLCLARRTITQRGGELAIESAPGAGTTVRIRLPAAP